MATPFQPDPPLSSVLPATHRVEVEITRGGHGFLLLLRLKVVQANLVIAVLLLLLVLTVSVTTAAAVPLLCCCCCTIATCFLLQLGQLGRRSPSSSSSCRCITELLVAAPAVHLRPLCTTAPVRSSRHAPVRAPVRARARLA